MIQSLSTFNSPKLESNMVGVGIKQFQRTYLGNYKWNFPLCLSKSSDFKIKNYTNFYLTNTYKFSDVFNIDTSKLKAVNISTTIQYGDTYLQFKLADSFPYAEADRYEDHVNYGDCRFTTVSGDDCNFVLGIFDNNKCNIYYTYEYKKYYLVADASNKLAFVKEKLITFDSTKTNPQDFKYMLSEDQISIQLFKSTKSGEFFVTKVGNRLEMNTISPNNIVTYLSQPPFKLRRNVYTYPNISLNTSFITYSNNNTLDYEKSTFNLKNNFLIHKKYSQNLPIVDIIPLKNQLLQNDVFASGNNMIYSSDDGIYVESLRSYASISQDIKEETTDELDLNYVFYNKSYEIMSGSNYFTSPSSMYPFTRLNINDSKFIDCGAFSFDTPQYADKVYHISREPQNSNNGQYLLCTWLSGAPQSPNKVWVDRYYYPDRIEKSEALSNRPTYASTYDDYIESLILNNASVKSSVDQKKFFDKLSDFSFEPNEKYLYERIKTTNLTSLSSNINVCNNYQFDYPTNYFNLINSSNKFTIGFYFMGDDSNWIVKSDVNAIESGVFFEKNQDSLHIRYQLFDPSNGTFKLFEIKTPYKKLKENFVCVSVNAITGIGYFFLNNETVESFTLPIYQYVKKQLLYGDLFVFKNQIKTNILIYNEKDITTPFISDKFTDPNLSFVLPILNGKLKINDLIITLPCGMRNSVDNVEYFQSVCGSSAFKSNNINVIIKNLNISNKNILKGIENSITTSLEGVLPINNRVNQVQFNNYK